MIRRFLQWLDDSEARKASRYLIRRRIRNERAEVRATARQLCEEMGKPVPKALRG